MLLLLLLGGGFVDVLLRGDYLLVYFILLRIYIVDGCGMCIVGFLFELLERYSQVLAIPDQFFVFLYGQFIFRNLPFKFIYIEEFLLVQVICCSGSFID